MLVLKTVGIIKERRKKVENPIPVRYKLKQKEAEPEVEKDLLHKWICKK